MSKEIVFMNAHLSIQSIMKHRAFRRFSVSRPVTLSVLVLEFSDTSLVSAIKIAGVQ